MSYQFVDKQGLTFIQFTSKGEHLLQLRVSPMIPEHLHHHLELTTAEEAVRVNEIKTEIADGLVQVTTDGLIRGKDLMRQLFEVLL